MRDRPQARCRDTRPRAAALGLAGLAIAVGPLGSPLARADDPGAPPNFPLNLPVVPDPLPVQFAPGLPGDERARDAPENPVFLDSSPVLADTLARAQDHVRSGNLDEAARLYQWLLDTHTFAVVETADARVFEGLRARVHRDLRASAPLLERYRQRERAGAAERLGAGDWQGLAHARLLTEAGLTGALRWARTLTLDGHFHAARLVLKDCAGHPDLAGAPAQALLQELVALLAPRVTRPSDREALQAMLGAGALAQSPATAPAPGPRAQPSVTEGTGLLVQGQIVARSMGTGAFTGAVPVQPPGSSSAEDRARYPRYATLLRAWPVLTARAAIVSAEGTLTAIDRLTGRRLWAVDGHAAAGLPRPTTAPRYNPSTGSRSPTPSEEEDAVAPVVVGALAVAVTTHESVTIGREQDILLAVEHATGRVRWARTTAELAAPDAPGGAGADAGLLAERDAGFGAVVRGPLLADSGVVVVCLSKDQRDRRVRAAQLAGIDALTGALRWLRPVGSTGIMPYLSNEPVADGASLAEGVVYRSDRLGVVGAYRAVDGLPLWVRHLPMTVNDLDDRAGGEPWTMAIPVVDADAGALWVLGPDRRRVLELDALTGALRAARRADDFRDAQYILQAGEHLVGVGRNRLYPVPKAQWASAPVLSTPPLAEVPPGIRGRVTVAQGQLVVPVPGAVRLIDPAQPDQPPRTIAIDSTGTPLMAGETLIVVDDAFVHTYTSWDTAHASLLALAASEPSSAAPSADLLALADRSGRAEHVLPALQQGLKALRAAQDAGAPAPQDGVPARTRLVELALSIARRSARAPLAGETGVRLSDSAQIDQAIDLARQIAATAGERASVLLVRAEVSALRAQPLASATDYHALLADEALRDAPWTGADGASRAGDEATNRLIALARSAGRATLATFDQQADALITQALASPDAHTDLARALRAYPVALRAPGAWLQLAQRAQDDPARQMRAVEQGLRASASIPDAPREVAGELHGRLIHALIERRLPVPAADALRRAVTMGYEGALIGPTGAISAEQARARIGALGAGLAGNRPRIGSILPGQTPQLLAGWSVAEALLHVPTTQAPTTPLVVMHNDTGQPGLFGLRAGDLADEAAAGALRPLQGLWVGDQLGARAEVLQADAGGTTLYLPERRADAPTSRIAAGSLLRIDAAGAVAWRTPPFAELFPDGQSLRVGAQAGLQSVLVPIDGARLGTELVAAADQRTLTLADRLGRAAAFDAQTGQVLWTAQLPFEALHETTLIGGYLALAGATPVAGPPQEEQKPDNPDLPRDQLARTTTVISLIDARVGGPARALPCPVGEVRWMRAVGPLLIVCGEQGLCALDPETGATLWSLPASAPGAGGLDAWVLHDRLFTLAPERALHMIDPATGKVRDKLDDRGVLSTSSALYADELPAGVVSFRSERGVVLFAPDGRTLGSDGPLGESAVTAPVPVAGGFLTLTATGASSNEPGSPAASSLFSLVTLDARSAKAVASTTVRLPHPPLRLSALEGRVLVTTLGGTVVLQAPVK